MWLPSEQQAYGQTSMNLKEKIPATAKGLNN